jgi:hypothetical protein
MKISDADFKAANCRAAAKQAAFPAVVAIRYDRRTIRMFVSLASGLDLAFSVKDIRELEGARAVDFATAEISSSGMGVHFPRLDADIYVPALLQQFVTKHWLAAEIGKLGGAVSSAAKTQAARMNGKLGGRPKKQQVAANQQLIDNLLDVKKLGHAVV